MASDAVYSFDKLSDPPYPLILEGAFRNNIKIFLQKCCKLEDYEFQSMKVWTMLLVKSEYKTALPLYILEEETEKSQYPRCQFCKNSGWGIHFLTKRRYHLLVTSNSHWNEPLESESMLENLLLHAMIHCNGLGHLVTLNGIEGGSSFIRGQDLMQMFDGLCTTLGTRKVTVDDLARKFSLDLRLIHGLAFGSSWFSRWGYSFHQGCFGINEQDYKRAVEHVRSITIDDICSDPQLDQIIGSYMANTNIFTVGDLLKFMLFLLSNGVPNGGHLRVNNEDIRIKDFTRMFSMIDSRERIISDLQTLVRHLVDSKVKSTSLVVQVITNARHLIKEWPLVYNSVFDVRCFGFVVPSSPFSEKSSPGDLIVMPYSCSYKDLMAAAEETFQDTYCVMENYKVNCIEEFGEDFSDAELGFLMDVGAHIRVVGDGLKLDIPLKYEGGAEVEKVQCLCGASSFDGEDTLKCLLCRFHQHSKCNGIKGMKPSLFICNLCCLTIEEKEPYYA